MIEENRVLELKVGIFVFVGLVILSIFIFSIGDISLVRNGYHLKATFHFVNGLAESSPVRLAGVYVGEVERVEVYFDEQENTSKVLLDLWIESGKRIEKDAIAKVNTLGILGEKYLEIFPGHADAGFLSDGDTIVSEDPVAMEAVTRQMQEVATSVERIMRGLRDGEGTLGKLLTDEALYTDLQDTLRSISAFSSSASDLMVRVQHGEGTIGRLFTDQALYMNLEEFTADIKAHPWKLLHKPREKAPAAKRR